MRKWVTFLMRGSAVLGIGETIKRTFRGSSENQKRNTRITKWGTFRISFRGEITHVEMIILLKNEPYKRKLTLQASRTLVNCVGLGHILGWKALHYHLFYYCKWNGWNFAIFSRWGIFKIVIKLVFSALLTALLGLDGANTMIGLKLNFEEVAYGHLLGLNITRVLI